jgi:hypothetical protein
MHYLDGSGGRARIPTEWTDEAPVDPLVVATAGRCPFRTDDLVELSALMDALRGPGHGPAEGVAGLMP